MGRKRKIDFSSDQASKTQKLSNFGFFKPSEQSPTKSQNNEESLSLTPKTPSSRNFLEVWKTGRQWLEYNAELKQMFCRICIDAQVSNSFTSGCSVMKKESVTKHELTKGDNSHSAALQAKKGMMDMTETRKQAIKKSKTAILSALRNVYFSAVHDLANSLVPELNRLCIMQGAVQLRDLQVDNHTTYDSSVAIAEFQVALAQVIEDQLLNKIRDSGVYSILCDESTDISVHQNLLVYIRILEKIGGRTKPVTYFLGVRQLDTATADAITTKIKDLLSSKNIELGGLVGISTDGASVMTGCKSGVVTQLRDDRPGLLATHCIAHRLALSSGGAADEIPYLVKFQEILNNLYKFFSKSPKNMAKLESIQAVLNSRGTRLKQAFHTRWLSFEGSVRAILENYSNLLSVFLEEKSAKALCLHKPISTYKFLYCAHFLADSLKHLAILCKSYQKATLDFTQVNPLLHSTVTVLENLLEANSGPNISKFLSEVPPEPLTDSSGLVTFQYQGHTIRDSESQRSEAINACRKFIHNVVRNLRSRFTEEGDAAILSALTRFFDPNLLEINDEQVQECIRSDVSNYLSECQLGSVAEINFELKGFQGFAKANIIKNGHLFSSVDDVVQLAFKSRDMFRFSGLAAERLLAVPVSTVECERGFSRLNIIKTDLRNRISQSTLDSLLRISINDCPVSEFDFESAFNKWEDKKSRRILCNLKF